MDEMIQKRKIIPRIDRAIGYFQKRCRKCVEASNAAFLGGFDQTNFLFHMMWYGFQEKIRELTKRKEYLTLVRGIGMKNSWPQCNNLIEEYERYIEKLK